MSELGFIALALTSFAGGVLQTALGFGLGLTVVPALAIAGASWLPATGLMIGLAGTLVTWARNRGSVDVPAGARIALGRFAGAAVGGWLLAIASARALSLMLGAALLATALYSWLRPAGVVTTPRIQLGAGLISGIMATTTAVGGPATSLAYQGRPTAQFRATVSLAMASGVAASLVAVALAGEMRSEHALLALGLIPFALAGTLLTDVALKARGSAWLPRAVIGFAALAGLVTLARAAA